MKTLMFIVIFFMIGALFIISENNLALKDSGSFNKFVSLYSGWLAKVFENTKSTTGYIVRMDWLPSEK